MQAEVFLSLSFWQLKDMYLFIKYSDFFLVEGQSDLVG